MEYTGNKWNTGDTWWLDEGRWNRIFRDRSQFFLHPGTVSHGCITVDTNNQQGMAKYNNLAEMLKKNSSSRTMIVIK